MFFKPLTKVLMTNLLLMCFHYALRSATQPKLLFCSEYSTQMKYLNDKMIEKYQNKVRYQNELPDLPFHIY